MVGVPDKMTSLWGYKVGIDNKLAAPEVKTRGIQSYLQRTGVASRFHSTKAGAHTISCLKNEQLVESGEIGRAHV